MSSPLSSSHSSIDGETGSDSDSSSSSAPPEQGTIVPAVPPAPPTASTIVVNRRRGEPRRPTLEPKGTYIIEEIHDKSWAPTKPLKTMRKFRSVCGYVARARVSINLPHWKKLDQDKRQKLVAEIMQHFHVEPHLREKVEHCALKKARDAWRNWKYVLHKKIILKDLHPFNKYSMIENDEWTQFKAYRLSVGGMTLG